MRKAIEIRAAAHSFEGKVFTITSSSIIDDTIVKLLGDTKERHEALKNGGTGLTGVFGPNGLIRAGPLVDNEEGILYADIDLEEGIKWKMYHDYSGNYNRFDVLSLNVNRRATSPLNVTEETSGDVRQNLLHRSDDYGWGSQIWDTTHPSDQPTEELPVSKEKVV
jgi:hypothetical protein